MNPSDNNFAQ